MSRRIMIAGNWKMNKTVAEAKELVAGLKEHYAAEDLVGKLIVVVKNLKPRKMRGEESQGMLLAASTEDHSQVILISPSADIAPGAGVS